MNQHELILLHGVGWIALTWLLLIGPHNVKALRERRKRIRHGEIVKVRLRWPGVVELRVPSAALRQQERKKEAMQKQNWGGGQ